MKSLEPDARALAAALHDGLALCLAFFAATMLLGTEGPGPDEWRVILAAFAVAVPIQLAINFLFGIYQGMRSPVCFAVYRWAAAGAANAMAKVAASASRSNFIGVSDGDSA